MNRRVFFKYTFLTGPMGLVLFCGLNKKKPVKVIYKIIPKDQSRSFKSARDLYRRFYSESAHRFHDKHIQNGSILRINSRLSPNGKMVEGAVVYRDRKAFTTCMNLWHGWRRNPSIKEHPVKYVFVDIM